MKRCRFGLAVLVLLLALGLLCGRWTEKFFAEASRQICLAAEAPPEEAGILVRKVYAQWNRRRCLHAVLFDQDPLEEADTLFALLDPGSENFRENCLRLSLVLEALARAQQPCLENVL